MWAAAPFASICPSMFSYRTTSSARPSSLQRTLPARERLRAKLEKILSDEFPSAISRVSPLELGPPVGWPVQYRVSGPDVDQVRAIALKVAQIIATNPKAEKVNFDWIEPARQVRIRVDQDEARLLGLSSQAMASVLNTVVSGTSVTQVRDDIYLVDVIARATDEQRVSLDTLRTVQVPLPGGRTVPLSQFATFEYGQEYPLIWRRDRVPTLTVQADIVAGALPETVVSSLSAAVEALRKTLPASYNIVVGGTVEESAEVAGFRHRRCTGHVAHHAHRPHGAATELPAVVPGPQRSAARPDRRRRRAPAVRQAAGLRGNSRHPGAARHDHQECGNPDRPDRGGAFSGKTVWDAAIDASSSRFRPIMLTAVSTVLGMIPIAPTVFWGPMAFAIMGGLLVATILTLIFLPTLYVAWFRGAEGSSAPSSSPV